MIREALSFFRRRKTETRSSFTNPEPWLIEAFGGRKGTSGESVTELSSLSLSAYYACIRNISEDVAKLPLILYAQGDDERVRDKANPVYSLLRAMPNPQITSMAFRETLTSHAIGWGNGYAEIEFNRSGVPIALWPLDPSRVKVELDKGWGVLYVVQETSGNTVALPPEKVLHIHGLGFTGLVGYSVAKFAQESIGGALAAQKTSSAFFGNGARPGGTITYPGRLSDKALSLLRDTMKERYEGSDNAGRWLILEEGATATALSIPPNDAQFLETRQFHVEDVCRWFRMPPHKVGHLLRAAGWSTLEAVNSDYLTDTLMPWLVRWEQEINKKLLFNSDTLYVEHLCEALLRADTQTRYGAYSSAISSGWMTRNEVRVRENLNPEEGLDEFLVPNANAVPMDQEPQDEDPPDDLEDDEVDVRAVALPYASIIDAALTRISAVEQDKIKRGRQLEEYWSTHASHVQRNIEPIIGACMCSAWAAVSSALIPETLSTRSEEIARSACENHLYAVMSRGIISDDEVRSYCRSVSVGIIDEIVKAVSNERDKSN